MNRRWTLNNRWFPPYTHKTGQCVFVSVCKSGSATRLHRRIRNSWFYQQYRVPMPIFLLSGCGCWQELRSHWCVCFCFVCNARVSTQISQKDAKISRSWPCESKRLPVAVACLVIPLSRYDTLSAHRTIAVHTRTALWASFTALQSISGLLCVFTRLR